MIKTTTVTVPPTTIAPNVNVDHNETQSSTGPAGFPIISAVIHRSPPARHLYRLYLVYGHTIDISMPADDPPPKIMPPYRWFTTPEAQAWFDRTGIIVSMDSVIAIGRIEVPQ